MHMYRHLTRRTKTPKAQSSKLKAQRWACVCGVAAPSPASPPLLVLSRAAWTTHFLIWQVFINSTTQACARRKWGFERSKLFYNCLVRSAIHYNGVGGGEPLKLCLKASIVTLCPVKHQRTMANLHVGPPLPKLKAQSSKLKGGGACVESQRLAPPSWETPH